MKVFVYGSLKKGFWNHHYLSDSKYLGDAFTNNNYALFVSGLPYMVERKNSMGVKGEVYEVDEITLKMLDRLEGHPNFYERKPITVTMFTTDEEIECQSYVHPDKFPGKQQLLREFS